MRIGICNVQGEIKKRFSLPYDVPEQFRRFIVSAVNDVIVKEYNILELDLPLNIDECDAYLITGSPVGVYDDYKWINPLSEFIKKCDQKRVKLMGICFGHQLIAHVLGGYAEKYHQGWNLGILDFEYQDPNDEVFKSSKLFFCHQDQVTKLPPKAKLLAQYQNCKYAGYMIEDHILCFQGHPEYDLEYMQKLVRYLRVKVPSATFQNACNSLKMTKANSQVIAQWVSYFLNR